jgi:alcohol dehydrogenase (cytochrome c)
MGLGGKERVSVGQARNAFQAIDYRTGKPVWRHEWPRGGGGGFGVLTTAGGVVFTGDGNGNLVAFDAANGTLVWHTRIGNVTNAPQTYLLDGRQHQLVAVGTRLFDFVIY